MNLSRMYMHTKHALEGRRSQSKLGHLNLMREEDNISRANGLDSRVWRNSGEFITCVVYIEYNLSDEFPVF